VKKVFNESRSNYEVEDQD